MYQCSERSANHVITRDITYSIQQMLIGEVTIFTKFPGFLGVSSPRVANF